MFSRGFMNRKKWYTFSCVVQSINRGWTDLLKTQAYPYHVFFLFCYYLQSYGSTAITSRYKTAVVGQLIRTQLQFLVKYFGKGKLIRHHRVECLSVWIVFSFLFYFSPVKDSNLSVKIVYFSFLFSSFSEIFFQLL